MSISDAQAKVAAFHRKFGVAQPGSPQHPGQINWPNHNRRLDWIGDERQEGKDARDLAELADAYIDIIYFALGGLVELGIDGGPLFDAVHAANMLKVKLPGVAKIAKPPGWTPPDIAALIEQQRTPRPTECSACDANIEYSGRRTCPGDGKAYCVHCACECEARK